MTGQRFEIFRREGGEPHARNVDKVEMVFRDDGALVIDGVCTGPAAEAFWGDWDHEFQMRVPLAHVRAFVAAVFSAGFTMERAPTFGDLLRICREKDIPVEEWSWT